MVVGGGVGLVEDVGGDDAGLVHRDVGEGTFAGDVADGPHAVGDAEVVVDGKRACGWVDAEHVGTNGSEVHCAARGDE